MPAFTPEEFEEEKYTTHLPDLQTAYKRAFDRMNEEYDRELAHALDQQVLNESEPHYEGNGEFSVELPPGGVDRIDAVSVDEERAQAVLDEYVEELERQFAAVFGDEDEPRA